MQNRGNEDIMKEVHSYCMKLQENLKRNEEIEMKIYDVNQLKVKALAELGEVKIREEMIKERLKSIHDNYLTWVRKINNEEIKELEHEKIQKLMAERDDLRERLAECKRSKEEDNEKIEKLDTMIKIEKNRYVALLRKLEKTSQMKNISQDLRVKINAILNSPPLDDA